MFRVRITFLGTSATFPTKDRNHPGIFLEFMNEGLLFDCGENIQRQFRIAGISITKITRIFITHWHGDHVLGLPGVLFSLANSEYKKKLYIYGPKGIKEKIKALIDIYEIPVNFPIEIVELKETYEIKKLIDEKEFEIYYTFGEHTVPVISYAFKEKDKRKIKVDYVRSLGIPTPHPILGKLQEGIPIVWKGKTITPEEATYIKKGFKVTYITDTIFKENLIELAKESDILIVESTYSKNEKEIAKEHYHMTTEDAERIAKESKSKILILTHFSQRYKNPEEFLNEITFKPAFIAKDFMQIIYVKNKIIINGKEFIREL